MDPDVQAAKELDNELAEALGYAPVWDLPPPPPPAPSVPTD